MKNACEFSTVQNGYNCVLPNGVFQGIDISNGGNIYVGSGNENNGGTLVIAKMNYSNNSLSYKETAYIYSVPRTNF